VETEEEFVSGLLSARLAITPASMAYLSLARGAKSGGINVAIVPAGVDATLDPETANTLELGWKSQWLSNRLQLNLAAFWTDVDDYQTTQRDRARNTFYLANAGAVRSGGLEFEGRFQPVPSLRVSLFAGWHDATFTSFRNAPCPVETVNPTTCDFSGDRVPGSPPWTASGTVHYEFPLDKIAVRAFVDAEYTHSASYRIDSSNYTREEAYGLANLQLGVQGRDDRWRVWAWAKNLLDEDYFVTLATSGVFASGAVFGLVGDPRMYGLSARARF
jgi:iron complex outermembrane receptor protein